MAYVKHIYMCYDKWNEAGGELLHSIMWAGIISGHNSITMTLSYINSWNHAQCIE